MTLHSSQPSAAPGSEPTVASPQPEQVYDDEKAMVTLKQLQYVLVEALRKEEEEAWGKSASQEILDQTQAEADEKRKKAKEQRKTRGEHDRDYQNYANVEQYLQAQQLL